MIKKLLLTFSLIALAIFAFSETTYAAQEEETPVVSEELTKLSNLYKEGVITEEEFSTAKSMLLDPALSSGKKAKKKTTAAERKRLKEAEAARLEAEKERLRAEKKALRQARKEEKKRLLEERRKACAEDSESEACKVTIVGSFGEIKTKIGSGIGNIFKKN